MRQYKVFDNRNEEETIHEGSFKECIDYVRDNYINKDKTDYAIKYIEVGVKEN